MEDTVRNDTIGSHRAYADFWSGASDKDTIVEYFSASWSVPSAPVAPHDEIEMSIWAGLSAYSSDTQIQVLLRWIPRTGWFILTRYSTEPGKYKEIGGYSVHPGDVIEASFKLNQIDSVNTYDILLKLQSSPFGPQNDTPFIKLQVDMPCPLNRAFLSVDQDSDSYLNLPPDDHLSIYTSFTIAIPSWSIMPTYEVYWTFYPIGAIVPSGKMGWVANHGVDLGEVVFGFK